MTRPSLINPPRSASSLDPSPGGRVKRSLNPKMVSGELNPTPSAPLPGRMVKTKAIKKAMSTEIGNTFNNDCPNPKAASLGINIDEGIEIDGFIEGKENEQVTGCLVYSYYYAKDVPGEHQNQTNYLWICCFAILGTAARFLISYLMADELSASSKSIASSEDEGIALLVHVIFRDIWSNALGCMVMGFVFCNVYILENFPALYAGLTTG